MPSEWPESALLDLATTDLSLAQIAKKYGRDRSTVIDLLHKSGIVRTKKIRNGLRRTDEATRLSPAHRALGVRITLYRGVRTTSELAQELNVSRYVVRMMEIGAHDFTLTQLQKLSRVMGQTIEQLLTPYREKP